MSTNEPRFEITFTSEADSDDFKTLTDALEQKGYELSVDLSEGRVAAKDRENTPEGEDERQSISETVSEDSVEESPTTEDQETATEEDTDNVTAARENPDADLECPECGKPHDSLSSLSGHISRSKDHDDISSYFTAQNGGYSCPEHADLDIESRKALSTHFQDEHDVSLLEYLIENYEDLNVCSIENGRGRSDSWILVVPAHLDSEHLCQKHTRSRSFR